MAGVARGNIGGLARAIASFASTDLAFFALGLLGVGAALKLIPQLLDAVAEGAQKAGLFIGDMNRTNDEATKILDKNNVALREADEKYNKLADSIELNKRAQAAANAGLIEMTGNQRLLGIEYQSQQARVHGLATVTEDYAKALKSVGIEVLANTEDLLAKEAIFFNEYERLVKTRGIDVANRWAAEHKSAIQKIIDESVAAGAALTPGFEAMAAAVNIYSKAYDEAAKAAKRHQDAINNELDTLKVERERLAETIREIEAHTAAKLHDADVGYAEHTKAIYKDLAALESANEAGALSDQEYRNKFAAIQLQLVDDRRKKEAADDVIRAAANLKEAEAQLKEAITEQKTRDRFDADVKARDAALAQERTIAEAEHELDMARDSAAVVTHAAQMKRFQEHIAAFSELQAAAKANLRLTAEQFDMLAKKIGGSTQEVINLYAQITKLGIGAVGDVPMTSGGVPNTAGSGSPTASE